MARDRDKNTSKNKVSSGKSPSKQSVDKRLKIFANLIVDRLLEEQKNGNLKLRSLNG